MEGTVPTHRIYTLNANGQVVMPPTIVEAGNDEAAIERARELQNGRDVEIWCETRCVLDLAPR
jgi:hypothetical protein